MDPQRRRTLSALAGALLIGAATGRVLLDSMNDPSPGVLEALAAHRDAESTPALPSSPAERHRLILVVFDGLGEGAFRQALAPTNLVAPQAPQWEATVDVGTPSLSRPVYHVLLTGAPQSVTGIRNNAHAGAARADDLAARVRATGGTVGWALEGVPWFHDLFGQPGDFYERAPQPSMLGALTSTLFGEEDCLGPSYDFMGRVLHEHPTLTVLHFTKIDQAGHAHGGDSAIYRRAAEDAVGWLVELRDSYNLRPEARRAVWMLGADHGHLAKGGHGGPEPEVRLTRWIGLFPPEVKGHVEVPGVVPADRLASTFAAILGVPPPREAIGEPLPLPDRPVAPAATLAPRQTATLAAVTDSAHRAHRGVALRGALWLAAILALAIAAARRGKLRALASATLPALAACAGFWALGPGMTLSAIRTHLGFMAQSTAAMALGAALALPAARRLGAPLSWIFVAAGLFPAAAYSLVLGSMGECQLPDSLLLLFPATGIVPWGVCLGACAALAVTAARGSSRRRRSADTGPLSSRSRP